MRKKIHLVVSWCVFYGISILMGDLMPNPVYVSSGWTK